MHQIFDASDLLRVAAKESEAADIRRLLGQADALLSQAVSVMAAGAAYHALRRQLIADKMRELI